MKIITVLIIQIFLFCNMSLQNGFALSPKSQVKDIAKAKQEKQFQNLLKELLKEKDKKILTYTWFKFEQSEEQEKELFFKLLNIKFIINDDDKKKYSNPEFINFVKKHFTKKMKEIYNNKYKKQNPNSEKRQTFLNKILNTLSEKFDYYLENCFLSITDDKAKPVLHNPKGKYVIKIFKNFNKEILFNMMFEHKNIGSGINFVKNGKTWYMIMEKYTTLEEKLFKKEKINNFNLVKDVLNGLKYLKEKFEIVHRDIKIQNIVFDEIEQKYKIIDFGSFRKKGEIKSKEDINESTSYITAPEAINEEYEADYSWDIYSLGCVFFGRLLYDPYFGPITIIDKNGKNIKNEKQVAQIIFNEYRKNKNFENDLKKELKKLLKNKGIKIVTYISENLFDLMFTCFSLYPEDRPTTDELLKVFNEKANQKGKIEEILEKIKDRKEKNNIKRLLKSILKDLNQEKITEDTNKENKKIETFKEYIQDLYKNIKFEKLNIKKLNLNEKDGKILIKNIQKLLLGFKKLGIKDSDKTSKIFINLLENLFLDIFKKDKKLVKQRHLIKFDAKLKLNDLVLKNYNKKEKNIIFNKKILKYFNYDTVKFLFEKAIKEKSLRIKEYKKEKIIKKANKTKKNLKAKYKKYIGYKSIKKAIDDTNIYDFAKWKSGLSSMQDINNAIEELNNAIKKAEESIKKELVKKFKNKFNSIGYEEELDNYLENEISLKFERNKLKKELLISA